MEAKLSKKLSFEFQGAAFTDVTSYIAEVGGADITIDPALENVPITLRLSDISVLDALHTLARIAGDKKVEIRDDDVWITSR